MKSIAILFLVGCELIVWLLVVVTFPIGLIFIPLAVGIHNDRERITSA